MGVPGFFQWLLRENNKIILHKLHSNVESLYIDANCLFHPQCFVVLHHMINETNVDKLEAQMIKRIITYIKFLINYVNPTKLIYIAVDGVAPVAKINQQRKRRYKSVVDNKIKYDLMKKNNMMYNDKWSNIVITPGTDFMDKLHEELIKFSRTNNKIIYSSYKEVGEGEHKILQYLKNNKNNNINVIYGLDADLIFLAMASKLSNIYLLREESHINNKTKHNSSQVFDINDVNEPLCFLSIDKTIETYNKHIINKLSENADIYEINLNKQYNFIDDFIVLCFLLGNDFLPHIPSINIKVNGLEYLINAYIHMFEYTQKYLIQNDKIDKNQLRLILSYLNDLEDDYFINIYPKYKDKMMRRKPTINNNYELELFNYESSLINNYDDKIKLGYDTREFWKYRYYEHHFHSSINQEDIIKDVCNNYFLMLQWVYKYYFDKVPCYHSQYKFNNAPFISDLLIYIDSPDCIDFNFNFTTTNPITPEQQLLSVIPPQYKHILSKKIQKCYENESINYMLPISYVIDMHNHAMLWECEPILPYLDINEIIKYI